MWQEKLRQMREDVRQEEIDRYEGEVRNYHKRLAELVEAKRTHKRPHAPHD
eukprot:gene43137-22600_t